MTRDEDEAIANYRAARAAYDEAARREDAAFIRYLKKREAGVPTNGAALSRLMNQTSYLFAELSRAEDELWALDIDPWSIDDEDGVERTSLPCARMTRCFFIQQDERAAAKAARDADKAALAKQRRKEQA
jgi:hypothetical protein